MHALVLFACSTPALDTHDTAPSATAVEDPSWDWTSDEDHSPAWTSPDIEDAIHAALDGGFPSAQRFIDRYLELMAFGDEDCPGDPEVIDTAKLTHRGCTADSGYSYIGDALYFSESVKGIDGWHMSADFRILAPDGSEFAGGGTSSFGASSTGDWYEVSYGTWFDENAEDWLALGLGTGIEIHSDGGRVNLLGGLGVGDVDLYFDPLHFSPECESGEGSLLVHEPGAGWHRIDLTCGACGVLWFEGEQRGEACPTLGTTGRELLDR